jgi:GNAT superfamily N-acetyltransferase
MTIRVRLAELSDVDRLQMIEIDAGRRFRDVGLGSIADDPPMSQSLLARHIADDTAWVAEVTGGLDTGGSATDAPHGTVVGYILASIVDGDGHIDQVSVTEAASGRGIGRLLVEQVCSWVEDLGITTVTLTTFRDVAWNGPYYQRLGFVELSTAEQGPDLAVIRQAERDAGLDVVERIAMRRQLPT